MSASPDEDALPFIVQQRCAMAASRLIMLVMVATMTIAMAIMIVRMFS